MWDKAKDARLQKLKAQGYSFAEIGEMIGVSRNAAIGRFSRLSGKVFPSEIQRDLAAKQASQDRKAGLDQHRQEMIADIRERISRGVPKLAAIKSALNAGATFQIVGDALELSKQRIHQIVS